MIKNRKVKGDRGWSKEELLLFRLAQRRCDELKIVVSDVLRQTIVGAYRDRPMNLVEFCLHEAAHLITMGFHPREFDLYLKHFCLPGSNITEALGERFDDCTAILDSCCKNIGATSPEARMRLQEAFKSSEAPPTRYKANRHSQMADKLEKWFVGKTKGFPVTLMW